MNELGRQCMRARAGTTCQQHKLAHSLSSHRCLTKRRTLDNGAMLCDIDNMLNSLGCVCNQNARNAKREQAELEVTPGEGTEAKQDCTVQKIGVGVRNHEMLNVTALKLKS